MSAPTWLRDLVACTAHHLPEAPYRFMPH